MPCVDKPLQVEFEVRIGGGAATLQSLMLLLSIKGGPVLRLQ